MAPWFVTNPERLRFELDALASAGIVHSTDQERWHQGKLRLHMEVDGVHLIADFPDFYPYFRFEIRAPELSLARHQHPFGKNLCLLGRATSNWRTGDTLAAFIRERLPSVLGATQHAALPEEPQGEPFSDYFPYEQNTSLLIDSAWNIEPNVERGRLVIGLRSPLFQQRQPLPVRGAVFEIANRDGAVLASADESMRSFCRETITGAWYRTERLPALNDPDRFLAAIVQEHPSVSNQWVTINGDRISIIGIVFREELTQLRIPGHVNRRSGKW